MIYSLKSFTPKLWVLMFIMLSSWAFAVEPIDINTASSKELQQLQGVGPVIAERIIIYRETHGAFRSLSELTSVRGISTNVIEKNKTVLAFEAN